MSAAFVPTFTRELATRGKPAAFRLGAQVVTALLLLTGVLVAAGWRVRRAAGVAVRGRLRRRAGQAGPDGAADARDAAVPDLRRPGRGVHGDAELAAPLLRPGAFAGDVQRGDDRVRDRARAADAGAGPAGDRRDRHRHGARRAGAVGRPVAAAAPRGLPLHAAAGLERSGAAAGAAADGPGHARAGGHAGQRVREHAAGDRRGHRRGVVAQLRLPPDVPADRAVRRVDRHRHHAGHRAPGGQRGAAARCGARSPTG